MCRFKDGIKKIIIFIMVFQYILCVGSSCFRGNKSKSYFWVSIHPMCRFKLCSESVARILKRFNTSYVSVQEKKMVVLCLKSSGFNTSYVSVQATILKYLLETYPCFNTSYVSVQVYFKYRQLKDNLRFNTSYVSVQDLEGAEFDFCL